MSDSPPARPNIFYPQVKDQTVGSTAQPASPISTTTSIQRATTSNAPVIVSALAHPVSIQNEDPPDRSFVISQDDIDQSPRKTTQNSVNKVWKQRFCWSITLTIGALIATALVVFFVTKSHYEKSSSLVPATTTENDSPKISFQTTQELYGAVDLYLAGDVVPTLRYGPTMDAWDVSNIQVFDHLFSTDRNVAAEYFNSDLNSWKMDNAESMLSMFSGALRFNGNISSWNLSNVRDTSFMFNFSQAFSGDVSSWDVSKVETMEHMFYHAYEFQSDVSRWQVGNVKNMAGMFDSAWNFNSDISNWDVSSTEYMNNMFLDADRFNQDLSLWNVRSLQGAGYIFYGSDTFHQNLCPWLSVLPVECSFDESFAESGCPNTTDTVAQVGPVCYNCET